MIKNSLIILLAAVLISACAGTAVTDSALISRAESYTSNGVEAFEIADWSRAESFFQRALTVYQGNDDLSGQLVCYINLAEVGISTRDYAAVQQYLDRAAEITGNEIFKGYQGRVTLLYALNAMRHQKITQANSFLSKLLPVFKNNKLLTAPADIQLAAIASRVKLAFMQETGQQLWIDRYAHALDMLATKKTVEPIEYGRLARFKALLLMSENHYEQAEINLQAALASYKKFSARSGVAETLYDLSRLSALQKQPQKSRDYLKRSIAVFRYLKDHARIEQISQPALQ